MDLYVFPPSPNCLQVIALAKHLKLPFTLKRVNVPRGEQKCREFLEMNPNGRVPLLVDGALKLWESDAILHYLADKAGSPLLPRQVDERADVLRWMFWQSAHFGPACSSLIYENVAKRVFELGQPDAQEVQRAAQCADTLVRILNEHFEEQDYLHGNRLTIADFSLAAFGVYWREAGIPFERYPQVLAWYERIAALPAWLEALQLRQLAKLTPAPASAPPVTEDVH